MRLVIGTRFFKDVQDFAEASAVYSALRDKSGEGASTFPTGLIHDYGVRVARVSYNGNVWGPDTWMPGEEPLYTPYVAGGAS